MTVGQWVFCAIDLPGLSRKFLKKWILAAISKELSFKKAN
jgi:hypothetical protein